MDIRQVKHNSNKQNLESAFNIAEREFGVTRLLDVDGMLWFDLFSVDGKNNVVFVTC